jgi:hypothetical protein
MTIAMKKQTIGLPGEARGRLHRGIATSRVLNNADQLRIAGPAQR